jgi:hypothetical protein
VRGRGLLGRGRLVHGGMVHGGGTLCQNPPPRGKSPKVFQRDTLGLDLAHGYGLVPGLVSEGVRRLAGLLVKRCHFRRRWWSSRRTKVDGRGFSSD